MISKEKLDIFMSIINLLGGFYVPILMENTTHIIADKLS